MKKTRRALAVALTVLLVVSAIPFTAVDVFAANGVNSSYESVTPVYTASARNYCTNSNGQNYRNTVNLVVGNVTSGTNVTYSGGELTDYAQYQPVFLKSSNQINSAELVVDPSRSATLGNVLNYGIYICLDTFYIHSNKGIVRWGVELYPYSNSPQGTLGDAYRSVTVTSSTGKSRTYELCKADGSNLQSAETGDGSMTVDSACASSTDLAFGPYYWYLKGPILDAGESVTFNVVGICVVTAGDNNYQMLSEQTHLTIRGVCTHSAGSYASVTSPATCLNNGTTTYYCNTCGVVTNSIPDPPALNHDFSSQTVTADYLKSAATCTSPAVYYYKCSRCSAHGTATYNYGSALNHDFSSQTVSPAYLKSNATCTSPAIYYYKCSRCAERGTETYTYGSELGHRYSLTGWSWSADHTSATATFTCANDPSHVETRTDTAIDVATVSAQGCESDYVVNYTASVDFGGATYTDTVNNVKIAGATGHDYHLTGWSWNSDHSSATAIFTCSHNSSHVETVTDSVIDVTTVSAQGCETDYVVNYTASVVFGGATYTDTVNNVKIADRTGHRYSLTGWAWNADHTSATATFTCENDHSHVVTATDDDIDITTVSEQGCETDYVVDYTASVEFGGATYTDTVNNVKLDDATGHRYSLTGWTWNADHTSATATFTCQNDSSHVETATDDDIDITTVSAQGCETDYVVDYTASVDFGGETYTDTVNNVKLDDATGHDYRLTGWAWNDDHTSATATFTCENDHSHVETATDDDIGITTVSEQGCETDYVVDYTASVDFGGATYTDTVNNVKLADRTGHRYSLTGWTWNGDHTSATATFTCENDPLHVETATDDDIDITTVSAQGCETDYVVDYTASVDFGGATYTDTVNNVKIADRTGHRYSLTGWTWNGDHTSATATFTCENDHSHVVTATDDDIDITTVSEKGCETDYVVDYTASVDFGGATYTDTVNNVKLADRTGHTPKASVDENFVLPGCETAGTHDEVVYCDVCSAEISRVQKTDDPLGHEFSVFVETVAPTCVDGGYTVYKCSRCDATENRDFTAVSTVHPWGEWQPNGDGTHSRVCSLSEDHVQSGACTFGGWTSDLAGHLLRTCSVCGYTEQIDDNCLEITISYNVNSGVDTEGALTEGKTRTPFTTTVKAKEGYHLDRYEGVEIYSAGTLLSRQAYHLEYADDSSSVTITLTDPSLLLGDAVIKLSAEKHNNHGMSVTSDATCTEDGYIERTCAECGTTWRDTLPAPGHADLNKDGVCDRCGYIVDESLAGDTGSAGNGADNEYHCWCGQGHPNNLIGWIQCFFTSLSVFLHKIVH